jgi:hypothetical protein
MDWNIIVPSIIGLLSAVTVALLENWDKINPDKKRIREMLQTVTDTKQEVDNLANEMQRMQSAQRTALQTQILQACKRINIAIDKGDIDYEEDLKQLIILYKEYNICGFNHQGQLYFNNTIEKASEHNNVLVRELMNTYFSDYEP